MKVNITDVEIAYHEHVILTNINLSVHEGEFVSILGPSGCGKSTLLNLLAGMLKQQQGHVFVDDQEVYGVSDHFAYMPQDDRLLPWLTILSNVCLYGKVHKQYSEAKKEALSAFSTFGLHGYEHAYPSELSGGMRQRAAFLRTSLCPADVMLLDEPFGALDVITRYDMQEWLASMRTRLHKTTILVTHDIDEAIYLSDRILIMQGRPAQIKKEIHIQEDTRTRAWLNGQGSLRNEIYEILREEQNDVD